MYTFKNGIYSSTKVNNSSIISGFGTKLIGDGRDLQNLSNYLKSQKIIFRTLVKPKQTHSTNIKEYNTSFWQSRPWVAERPESNALSFQRKLESIDSGFMQGMTVKDSRITELNGIVTISNCDGVVTKEKGVVLTVITADCVQIIFTDEENGVIGISHQGWKGSYDEMAKLMIEEMVKVGALRETIKVAIGPAIGACCYEVYGERLEMFSEKYGKYDSAICKENNKYYLNLSYINYVTFLNVGVKRKNVDFFPFCTSCDQRFYSYKRDKEIRGEMVSFVGIF